MAEAHATETVDSLLRYERKDINWFVCLYGCTVPCCTGNGQFAVL